MCGESYWTIFIPFMISSFLSIYEISEIYRSPAQAWISNPDKRTSDINKYYFYDARWLVCKFSFFSLVIIYYPFQQWKWMSLIYLLPKYMCYTLAFDFIYHWTHKLIHMNSWLYRFIHGLHHEERYPNIYSLFYMTFTEYMVTVIPSHIFALTFFNVNLFELILFDFIFFWIEMFGHSGQNLDFLLDRHNIFFWFMNTLGITRIHITDHDYHHTKNRANYGKQTSLWDWLFDTLEFDKPENTGTILDSLNQSDKVYAHWYNMKGECVETLTYRQLNYKSGCLANSLVTQYDLHIGDRVILAYPPGLQFIIAFCACMKAGIIPVPVYPPDPKRLDNDMVRVRRIYDDCKASAVLTNTLYPYYSQVRKQKLYWIIDWLSFSIHHYQIQTTPGQTAFIQYTSGSTGNPKGVVVTHKNIVHNVSILGIKENDSAVSWLPQYHDMGLIGYFLAPIYCHGTLHAFSPIDFIKNPALWFELITKHKPQWTSAPHFAYKLVTRKLKSIQNYDLSSLKVLMDAAEPVSVDSRKAFLDKFGECGINSGVYTTWYGLAEVTVAVCSGGEREIDGVVSCGKPLKDTEIKIVDGQVWVSSPSVTNGYYCKDELNKEVFKTVDGKRWVVTGDLGFIDNGELFINGRCKDVIIHSGRNIYPQDIERELEQLHELKPGGTVAFQEGEDIIVAA